MYLLVKIGIFQPAMLGHAGVKGAKSKKTDRAASPKSFRVSTSQTNSWNHHLPWEPTTFIFKGYNPYVGGLKPSFFMVLGSKGRTLVGFQPECFFKSDLQLPVDIELQKTCYWEFLPIQNMRDRLNDSGAASTVPCIYLDTVYTSVTLNSKTEITNPHEYWILKSFLKHFPAKKLRWVLPDTQCVVYLPTFG